MNGFICINPQIEIIEKSTNRWTSELTVDYPQMEHHSVIKMSELLIHSIALMKLTVIMQSENKSD